ncbi:ATP synthase subunit I [Amphritea sp. 1_MG-2023]|uniref:ATP synthase subunit I n=1 Tax=Amphritea sp. 1_MG-2023 TaxID=3062670 RepID=UPI0026E34B03|nr:ATP synthase subunit I [Amphritea sp. 1_MG-2023]MDO6562387.1 ATP synthase subunit I [Amphritea sp. 1_MG-2023]
MKQAKKARPGAKFTQWTRAKVKRVFQIQIVAIVVITLAAMLHSLVAAYSALLGGIVYLLPNAFFAWRVLGSQSDTPRGVLADMYIGEIWKMLITILCFAAVFILVQPLSPFPLFLTFILLQILNWYLQMKVDDRFLKL